MTARAAFIPLLALVTVLAVTGCTASPPPISSPKTVVVPPPPAPRPSLRPAPARRLDPAVLQGMTGEQAVALLGQPQREESREMARLWSWRQGRCVLTLAVYPEVGAASYRVLSADFSGTDDAAACLGALSRQGGTP